MPCEYCGRDLALVIENKWCCELHKVAQIIWEYGEYVMDLFSGRLYKCTILCRVVKKHRAEFPKAPFFSICYQIRQHEKMLEVMNRPSVLKNLSKARIGDKNPMKNPIFVKKMGETQKIRSNQPEALAASSKKAKEDWAKKTTEQRVIEQEHRTKAMNRPEVRAKIDQKEIQNRPEVRLIKSKKNKIAQLRRIAEGDGHLNGIAPFGLENFPLERILDLMLLIVFTGSARWTFRKGLIPPDEHTLQYQIDFVCRLLRFAIENDELYHEDSKVVVYDDRRNKFFIESSDFDIVYRGCKQLRAEADLTSIVKEIYELCNKQREKYQLWHLPILVFDDRWISYLEKMQELLKEHRLSKGSKKKRFKIFQDKKREIDRQYLWLLEETSRALQSSNFVDLVREALETEDCLISQKRIVSPWRK